MLDREQRALLLFRRITTYPRTAVLVAVVVIAVAASGLARLVKDTSVKAFIPPEHPALIADAKASEVFGLSDAIAVALYDRDASVFTPQTLASVAELTERLAALPNVRSDRVFSLATESSIAGRDGALDVDPYIDPEMINAASANDARQRWLAMPPHQRTLVSDDEHGTVILAPLVNATGADATYLAVAEIVAAMPSTSLDVHVAGPGAVSGYLSRYIDEDASKLQPLVFLVVLGFICLAFRRLSALPGPLLVIAGAAGSGLGIMAWTATPYYAITNALPVIIVAISVADSIHILSKYYQYRARDPDSTVREIVILAMSSMARPITLTSLTTIAGFIGIAVASIMPPVTAFAIFAALGVALAWLFSMLALPNVLILLQPAASPAFVSYAQSKPSALGAFLAELGTRAARNYPMTLIVFAAMTIFAGLGALQLKTDRSQVDNFAHDEPIRIADETINATFAGTAFLDILIETDAVDGLLDPARMQAIGALQAHAETLPHVQKTLAITDYLSVMHAALNEDAVTATTARQLPVAQDSIAQYLLLYEASGSPGDFDEEIDYDYQRALLRVVLNSHYFSETKPTVVALQSYIDDVFNNASMQATLAGDVAVSYHWMSRLDQSHLASVALSLLLVLATAVFVFRSLSTGIIAVLPVCVAVLALYAVMGYAGVYLEPATSMFAAIAIGVGVDFGIHLVERLTRSAEITTDNIAAVMRSVLPPAARACLFNSAALALGFSVLMISALPTLQRFGALVAVAALSSYIAALILVPTLFAARAALREVVARRTARLSALALLVGIVVATSAGLPSEAHAADLTADAVAQNIADRAEATAAQRRVEITLTNRRGRTRTREAVILRLNTDTARFTRITYTEPRAIRATSFLSRKQLSGGQTDSRWLYLPATRKVRRIPAADRGENFLGTDFSYEDIQSELKFSLADYNFGGGELITRGAQKLYRLHGVPKTQAIARQLGYGRFEALVDATTWLPAEVEFFDNKLKRLKTVQVQDSQQINGIWTALRIQANNHQTGHETVFQMADIRYADTLPAHLFESQQLARGVPTTDRSVAVK